MDLLAVISSGPLADCLRYPELQVVSCLGVAWQIACRPKLSKSAETFARESVVSPLLAALEAIDLEGLFSCYFKYGVHVSLKAITRQLPVEGDLRVTAANLCRTPFSREPTLLVAVLERLLQNFEMGCSTWPSRPDTVAKGWFAPAGLAEPSREWPLPAQWQGWHRWNLAFPWRDATAEESMGPAFEGYCMDRDRHTYREVGGRWFRKPVDMKSWGGSAPEVEASSCLERTIVFPRGLYFDSAVLVHGGNSLNGYSKNFEVAGLKLRFLFDSLVFRAAVQALQQMKLE